MAELQSSNELFWQLPAEILSERIGSSLAGIAQIEASRRLVRFGPNVVTEVPHRPIVVKIAKRFIEPLVIILLAAAAISGMMGEVASFLIIAAVIAFSITLDIVQEHRAELAADALKRSVAIHADVRRDGAIVSLPVEQLVPGDVVELRAGDLVPADGVVLKSRDAQPSMRCLPGTSMISGEA